MTKHYINLTNGLEFLSLCPGDTGYIRIQSTACEQKRWDFILQDLDTDLLFELARGTKCVVYDAGKRGESRALWQGLPWIRYVLARVWMDREDKAFCRGHNVTKYFAECYEKLDRRTLAKLKYFRRFVNVKDIKLSGVFMTTTNDGKYDRFLRMIANVEASQ